MKDRFGFDWSRIQGTQFWRRPYVSRRLFFRHAASALGGYMLMPGRPGETVAKAQAPPARAKNCILVMMMGGVSHVDTFDLKEGPWTPAGFEPESYEGVRFPRGILPTVAGQMHHVTLVRSVYSWALVHQLAQEWVQIGRNPVANTSAIAPHIGSVVSMELGRPDSVLPAFIALNAGSSTPGSGYFPPTHSPFFIAPNGAGLANTTHPDGAAAFDRRFGLLGRMEDAARGDATKDPKTAEALEFALASRSLMYNSDVDSVFRFPADVRARYGNTGFGNACLAARNLIGSGLGARFIQINVGGWDNHAGIYTGAFNTANQNALIRQFDRGLGNLLADLAESGKLDETLVVVIGEFGRTVGNLNAQAGRDHFRQQAVLFAGAGIAGPRAIGATNATGSATAEPGWSRGRDVRTEDIEATIYSALGIDWKKVRRDDPLGRGFEYVPFAASEDRYGPIEELWG